MDFIRSNLVRRRTSATEVIDEDLPTNPISHLIVAVEGYNVTDEATLAEILAFMNSVKVTDQGKVIVNVQSEDLYGLNCYLFKRRPHLTQKVATDNATRMLGMVIPFGRKLFNPEECYPGRKRGDLKLSLDMTALGTSIDNGQISIECVELPGATPSRYLKSVTQTVAAPGATGDNDIRLPIGNDLVALQLRMTTFPATSSHAYGVDDVAVLADNQEIGYMGNVAQSLVADGINRVDGQSGTIAAAGDILPDNIVWVDFDPMGDGNFLLKTAGLSDLFVRLTMGVNEATNMTVMELVQAG